MNLINWKHTGKKISSRTDSSVLPLPWGRGKGPIGVGVNQAIFLLPGVSGKRNIPYIFNHSEKFLSLLLLTTLTACTTFGTAGTPPIAATQTPWSVQSATAAPLQPNWWQTFNSPELNSLISKALAQNTSLAAALERIEQARLQARITGANALPTANASADAGRNLSRANDDTTGRTTSGIGANISYEVDLFGRLAAARQSSRKALEATEYDDAALKNITTTSVASTYFQALALSERIGLATQNLKLAEDVLNLLEIRFNAGVISGLERAQQRSSVESSRANLSGLKQQYAQTLTALAVLTGDTPQSMTISGTALAGLSVPPIPVSQPSTVLQQRPDIRAAEARLEAAHADITAARAALFPSLNLGAGASLAFDPATSALNLTASALAPLFHGGALRNALSLSKSRQAELAATYRGTVLQALKEGEDALSATAATSERLTYNQTAREEAAKAYAIARTRLQNGITDMPTLLQAQQADLQAADALTQTRLENLSAALNLILAVGGGWLSPPIAR